MSVAGLDIGSTGAKVTVLDESGALVHTGYMNYPVARHIHTHEVDANTIWLIVKALLKDAAAAAPDLSAVGLTSFGESFVLLDRRDHVLFPVMMYTDPRGIQQSDRLSDVLGAESIANICGTMPHPMFSLPKLMWVKQEQPAVYENIRRVCLIADFAAYMLTGEHVIDYSLATRTMGFDIHTLAWNRRIFDAAEIDPNLFGSPVPSGSLVGTVRPAIAKELGVIEDFKIVLCGHDQIAAAVGSGILAPGKAANGAGTVECITPVFAGVPDGTKLQKRNYSVIPFLGDGNYCCYAFSFTGGSLVDWFIKQLAGGSLFQAKTNGENVFHLLENAAPDRPSGILVLPHFAGAATPYMDIGAKGAFIGLTLTHTTADLYRAVMEGIAYESMLNLENLAEAGVHVEAINASGGCARSSVWLQIKADILGRPVTRLANEEAGTIGSIMLANVAVGRYTSLTEAADKLVKLQRIYQPRKGMYEEYQKHYARYRKLYHAIRPLMDGI